MASSDVENIPLVPTASFGPDNSNDSKRSGTARVLKVGRSALGQFLLGLVLLGSILVILASLPQSPDVVVVRVTGSGGESNCAVNAPCFLRVRVRTVSSRPVVSARATGPTTILDTESLAVCSPTPSDPNQGNRKSREYCLTLWPAEPGPHRVTLREDYTSLHAALADYAPGVGNPSFLGRVLSPDTVFQVAGGTAGSKTCVKARPGHWQRRAPRGKLSSKRQISCPWFYAPEVMRIVAKRDFDVEINRTEANTAVQTGLPLSAIRGQAEAALGLRSVRRRRGHFDKNGHGNARAYPDVSTLATAVRNELETETRSRVNEFRWVASSGECGATSPRHASMMGRLAAKQCLSRIGPVYFATDSIGRYLYHFLVCSFNLEFQGDPSGPNAPYKCNSASGGGVRLEFTPLRGITVGSRPKWQDVLAHLKERSRNSAAGVPGVWVVNAGAWDANYGRVTGGTTGTPDSEGFYLYELRALLRACQEAVSRGDVSRVVFLSATQVHPALYGGLPQHQSKQFLTSPRMSAVYRAQTEAFTDIPSDSGVSLLDVYHMTLGREDDPLTPSDMVHYGPGTVRAMAQALLAELCR